MHDYLTEIRRLLIELASLGIDFPKQIVFAWVLNNLDQSYAPIIQNIVQSLRRDAESYTIESLFANLIDESRGHIQNSEQIFMTDSYQTNQANRQKNHKVRTSSNQSTNKKRRISKKPWKKLSNSGRYCTHCHMRTHTVSDCWHLHPSGRPADWKPWLIRPKTNQNNNHQKIKQWKKMIAAMLNEQSDEEEIHITSHVLITPQMLKIKTLQPAIRAKLMILTHYLLAHWLMI
jgi:hypothetical protein